MPRRTDFHALRRALRPNDGLKNLVLLTAPLDFTDKTAGGFTRWVSHPAFDPDKLTEAFGNVPGEMIDAGAKMLKPVENYVGSYLNLWDNIEEAGRSGGLACHEHLGPRHHPDVRRAPIGS